MSENPDADRPSPDRSETTPLWRQVRDRARPGGKAAITWAFGIFTAVVTAVLAAISTANLTAPQAAPASQQPGPADPTSAAVSPTTDGADTPFTVAVHDQTTPCGEGFLVPTGQQTTTADSA